MSHDILYSVVVPHYNDVVRLARLLRSLPLGRDGLEVIVVDDCSTEVDALSALKLGFSSVSWKSTPRNSGAGAARNFGMASARGRWLLFADSDDEFFPHAFDVFDGVLKESDELVFFLSEGVQESSGVRSIRGSRGNELVSAYASDPTAKNLADLCVGHVTPWAKVWSLAFIRSTGIAFDAIRFANDKFFSVAAAHQAKRIRVVTEPVYRVYRRPGSLTDHRNSETYIERFESMIDIHKRLEARGVKSRLSAWPLIRSFKFGLIPALRIWSLALRSSFRFPLDFVWHPKRWFRLVNGLLNQRRETRSLKSDSRGKLEN